MCRVLDYSKYKYEQAQKLKQARKHQQQITVREIKFRPKIAEHDYDTKKRHVERFLRHKDKVKVTIMFRGREVTHPERGTAILDRLAEELAELGVVEQHPTQEGRNMTMMMAPSKAVLAGRAEVGEAANGEAAQRRPRRRCRRRLRSSPPRRANLLSRPTLPRRPTALERRGARPTAAADSAPADTDGKAAEVDSGLRRDGAPDPFGGHRRGIIVASHHAQDEDTLRRQEALQGHGRRKGPRPARLHEPHPREEVAQTQARARSPGSGLRPRRAADQADAGGRQMTRVKRSVHARKKRRATLELTKGFRGEAHSNYKRAKEALMKADAYAYRDRRNRKRDFRRLWITRINAAARNNGMSYSQFMHGLSLAGVELDRKVLADIAVRDADTFRRFADVAREASAA